MPVYYRWGLALTFGGLLFAGIVAFVMAAGLFSRGGDNSLLRVWGLVAVGFGIASPGLSYISKYRSLKQRYDSANRAVGV